ncbi:MAG TPA: adenylosuccinate lyase [bacterium]|nr:adenylosuccinate lyase [bacterium]
MIKRYSNPEMARIWTETRKLQKWLEVELAVVEAWSRLGRVPETAAAEIRRRARVNTRRVAELESVSNHDVVAFIEAVSETIGPLSSFFHLGLTSSDLLDTANALRLMEAADRIKSGLEEFRVVLADQAQRHRKTLQVGRTHGIHAEPISFGLKLCGFYTETERSLERIARAREVIAYGKISGAVGTYAHLSPRLEEMVCRQLGLKSEPVSTQVVPRDRYAEYLCQLAIIGTGLERFALEIRHLQRTEVGEAAEPFGRGQKGSSAMPHKQNPILCERICGLARLLRAYCQAGLEDVALWHERDISHSSVERVVLPDATITLDYLIRLSIRVAGGLRVFPERMAANLDRTGGLIYSQRLLSALVGQGLPRPEAYRLVQSNALSAIRAGRDFRELVRHDPEISRRLKPAELASLFEPGYFLRHQDEIYRRVFPRTVNKKEK